MTRPIRLMLFSGLVCLALGIVLSLIMPETESDGLILGEDIPYYSLPWNDNPFFPGEITTSDGLLANWETVPSSEFCAQCHYREYEEWVVSIHAVSGPDIIYETAINANEHAHDNRHGTEKIRWCDSCHEPLLTLMGGVNPLPVVGPNDAAAEGTSCIVCHTAVASKPLAGNGALTLAINNINNYEPALILAAPAEHARAMQARTYNPLMGQSELCGACHTEIRPLAINGDEPMNLQDTFDEWRRSEYAEMNIQCQDCHMSSNPAEYIAALNRGEQPERVVSHRFVGINYLLTAADLPDNLVVFLRGGHPPGDIPRDEWRASLLEQQHLILSLLQEAADLALEAPETAVPGEELAFDVTITNSGAGHDLPTGPRDQRYMWLEIRVTDVNGDEIYHKGWFNEQTGEVDPEAIMYLKLLYDEQDERITEHILFDVDHIEYTRNPIPARSSDTIPYVFTVPVDSQGPLRVEVRLWYRLALQELATYLLKIDVVIPPVVMAETAVEIPLQ
ncbi:MAG: cytochrome c family protein [Anaerolineae bacterium]|nr:cytochrome c family protein [Anaerolineae bacterium]